MMPKALSLFLPSLLVDLTRRQLRLRETGCAKPRRGEYSAADKALILIVEFIGSKQTVTACCPRCAHAGVLAGMSLDHARALLPEMKLHVEPHRPDRAAQSLHRLAVWLAKLVPVVAPDPPDGLLMDIAGCERLFGGPERHARRIGRAVWKLGLRCRISVAPTFGAAWGLARFPPRPFTIIGAANLAEAIAPLPIAALRVDSSAAVGLREIGVESIGEVLKLPRVSLASRFGPQLAFRLDQMFGQAMEIVEPVRPNPPLRAERVFDGGITHLETLHLAFRDLLGELTSMLLTRGLGARVLHAECSRVGSPPVTFSLALSRPSRNIKHLHNLFSRKIDTINMGFGVEAMLLIAARTGRLKTVQHQTWETDASPDSAESFAELVDVLSDRLGAHAVSRLVPVSTHIPERAFQTEPTLRDGNGSTTVPPDAPRERPTLLLNPPESATAIALVPDGPPQRLEWRGRAHQVITTAGPERIVSEWWLGEAYSRDYYRIQLDTGLWLWVFRKLETAEWRVHGIWA